MHPALLRQALPPRQIGARRRQHEVDDEVAAFIGSLIAARSAASHQIPLRQNKMQTATVQMQAAKLG